MTRADLPTSASIRCQPSLVATCVSPVTQGLLALIRCVALHGFHLLTVESYCMPGSPHTHALSDIFIRSDFASYVVIGSPVTTAFVVCVAPLSTARMNSSVTRTEWFAFWNSLLPWTSPWKEPSQPASIRSQAFCC